MDDIHVRLLKLPSTVYGVTVRDENGDFNVYINSNLSASAQDRALKHEMKHIKRRASAYRKTATNHRI